MPTDIIMPQMGESIFEGTITKWLKQPGEKVQRDEPLFEISTDKVDAEIPAPASGTLQDIKVQAGATVQVNTVVGTIAEEGAAAPAAAPAACRRQTPRLRGRKPLRRQTQARSLRRQRRTAGHSADLSEGEKIGLERQQQGKVEEDIEAGEQDRVRSSPLVRRIAKDNNVDLTQGRRAPVSADESPRTISRRSSPSTEQARRQRLRPLQPLRRLLLRRRLHPRCRQSPRLCSLSAASRRARSCPCRSCARRLPSTW